VVLSDVASFYEWRPGSVSCMRFDVTIWQCLDGV
jgi:hypothetical protein